MPASQMRCNPNALRKPPASSPRLRCTWTATEKELLIRLVYTRICDVELGCGNGHNAQMQNKALSAWNAIEKSFNTSSKSRRQVTGQQLRKLWSSMKSQLKHKRKLTGPNTPLNNRFMSAVEKMLHMVKRSETPDESTNLPPNVGLTTNSIEKDGNGTDVNPDDEHELATKSTVTNIRPQTESAASSESDQESSSPPALERQVLLATPKPSRDQGDELHDQPAGQPETLVGPSHHGAFRLTANAFPTQTAQSASPIKAILSPKYNYPYQKSSMFAMASSNYGDPSKNIHKAELQPAITTFSESSFFTAAEDASHTGLVQEEKLQCVISHYQALSSLERALHEKKIHTENLMAEMGKELHTATMDTNAALFEERMLREKMLQKREEELYSAKLHTEEVTANMQTELLQIQIDAARIVLRHAETTQRILEVKLRQAELELQNVR